MDTFLDFISGLPTGASFFWGTCLILFSSMGLLDKLTANRKK